MTVNVHVMPNSLIVIHNDTTVIQNTDPRYTEILKSLSTGLDEESIKSILYFKDIKPPKTEPKTKQAQESDTQKKPTRPCTKKGCPGTQSLTPMKDAKTNKPVGRWWSCSHCLFEEPEIKESQEPECSCAPSPQPKKPEKVKKPKDEDRIEVDLKKGKVLIDKVEMPDALANKLIELKSRHKPRSYLLNFWDKLQKNPSKNSIEMLYTFLQHNGHPIMADGSFIAYKIVRKDLMDHHSNTFKNEIGKVIKMNRKDVKEDPNELCASGLHVCSAEYFKAFHPDNSRYLEVLIDPENVVSVPHDYDGTKMRVCSYKVYREVSQARTSLTSQTQALVQKNLQKKIKKGNNKK